MDHWTYSQEFWTYSQEFQGGGRWIVHQFGPNRPNKMVPTFATEDEARLLAERLDTMERRIREEECRAIIAVLRRFQPGPGGYVMFHLESAVEAFESGEHRICDAEEK